MNLDKNNSRRDFLRHSALAAAGLAIAPASLAGAPSSEAPAGEASTGGFHQMNGGFGALPEVRWPGRIVVGGKTISDFVAIAEEPHSDASWTLRVFRSASVPALKIRAQWREVGSVTEWISFLVNDSAEPSGRVTELRSLAQKWLTRGPIDFYGNNGSMCILDDFEDIEKHHIDTVELSPNGGRSSDGILPFFAVTDGHDSLAVGIGWSGQWCATIRHSAEGSLQLEVGLPRVGFVLRPQESVRLPSVLLARAPGKSADQARRLVRAHLSNLVVPRTPEGKSPHFTAHGTMDQFHATKKISEASEIKALERAAEMGFETFWMDACWFGEEGTWWTDVGSWSVRRSDFPRGLRPISDRAHELGMKFVFWMEPERANHKSEWARAHPELFLRFSHTGSGDQLLNLGDPRAVDLAFEKASALITEFNADIFRQDFNTSPLHAWRLADAPDRIGMTEIRYIEGLYAFWDRLLAAHPNVYIDNCASGGRRIDLESLRRTIILWRSDTGDVPGKGILYMNAATQTQCWGLSQWLPDHAGPMKTFDAFAMRGALSTGWHGYRALPLNDDEPEAKDARAAIAETKRLRPLITDSERINLLRPSSVWMSWVAFQHHRHSDSRGFIVALRGPGEPHTTVTLNPEHIDADATYQITKWEDYVAASPIKVFGSELKNLVVTIPQRSSSVLIEYERVDG